MITIPRRTLILAAVAALALLTLLACATPDPMPASTPGAAPLVTAPGGIPVDTGGLAVTPAAAVAAPGGVDLSVDALLSYLVEVTWVDNSSDEAGFRVIRRRIDIAGEPVVIAETGPDVTRIDDDEVACGAVYQYLVLAFSAAGQSDASACVQLTVAACPQGSILPQDVVNWGPCERVVGACIDSTGRVIDNPAQCGQRADGCFCQGDDLFCNDILSEADSPECEIDPNLSCYCSGQDFVCFDTRGAEVSRSINDERRCGCRCVGPDVYCGTTGYVSTDPQACNCTCSGAELRCPDGSITPDSPLCGG